MDDAFYTPEEIATMLKVTRQAVYTWIQQGSMESIRIRRTLRIPREEVERLLREGRNPRKTEQGGAEHTCSSGRPWTLLVKGNSSSTVFAR